MTTVAITGPTGNFGHGLVPMLEADQRVKSVVGVARRPFDPRANGWRKLEYRRGDVRDRAALEDAFSGADAVAHLAFARFGNASRETLHAINVEGTMNAFAAAAAVGARRFVFASSVAAYGFHGDNPALITEDWPARGSQRWFYAREKAVLEQRLRDAAATHRDVELTILRPTVVVGPQTIATGGDAVPPKLRPLVRGARWAIAGVRPALPLALFPEELQFVHEDDVGQAFLRSLLDGSPGTYNLAGDGTVSGAQVLSELGLPSLRPLPGGVTRALAAGLARVPRAPAVFETVEIATRPVIVDSSRAKHDLGWRPRYSSIEALRAALSRSGAASVGNDVAGKSR